ncbi:Ig-like domain-containing protein [Leifsonia sp. H3M29-4]|uniref:Ig-like domain-containing protein n=1 Tax=Salinibacterium metalliresistens TaxID=3031321 RepID=UPI0023D9C4BB|nr:Ig-like domain-containing protein [Salinibacterium metalliresistens]MDF1480024.1 Ig-like domain-containing protein [Salinibacterium metalliresistens]
MRVWLRKHRSAVVSITSGVLIAALITTVAIVSTGYTAQRLDLGDGSVWVANGQRQALGRANTEVLELNSVVRATGNDLEVLQQGQTVLLFDRTENALDIVDPATSEVVDSVALPPNRPELFLAGDRLIVHEAGTGEVWIVPVDDLAGFDAESEASLSLGTGAVLSVADDGLLFAVSPASGQVLRVDTARSDAVESSQNVDVPTDGELSITSVAGRWAVLDAESRRLWLESGTVDLAGLVEAVPAPALQLPSVDGDRVLVAHGRGLVGVPIAGGGEAAPLVAGTSGTPARPLALGGCEYSAWTDGRQWRHCDTQEQDRTTDLTGMPGTAQLAFAKNGTRAVLNDARSGRTWAVQREGELIDNWDDLIVVDDDQPQEQQNDQDLPPEVERVQQPPIAVDDAFGARPGRATVLPVLLNDFDPNGDVLVIEELAPIDEAVGRLDLINQRQQVQLTLAPGAGGQVRFGYTISDGRGGSASAEVVVTVRGPDENSPPQQVRSTRITVADGGRVTTQVLGDWVDPDGDAFYLTSALVAPPDQVTSKPAGSVVYSDSGSGGDLKVITLVVSDGSAESSGSVSVSVRPAGEVPIVADPFVVLAPAGQEVTIEPLLHVRGGTGTVRLNSVPAKADVTIVPSYETGTFRFTSTLVRSHYLEYVVTDGTLTVTGLVRVDVTAPADANAKPITVPKTVFVQTLRNERVDVAATDVDPAGGVLLVTGVMNLPPASGVRAEVLGQRIVRVSLEKPLDDGPVIFNYRISNGLAESEGVITVIEIPAPARVQPPIAYDDSITVRVGDAIDIPVLRNDEHPDGLELTLSPKLDQQLPDDAGLLFASGDLLRYLAPDKTGNFTAAYRVSGPDGQSATALVRIAVREADAATNNAPVPETVTARVLAGESVRIRIPLSGTDPDGDSVQLLGQSTNPQKGSVVEVDGDTVVYRAGDYSAGTDILTYSVIDALGARAEGTIRVGISARLEGARNPVAIVDEVTVRPGVTVSVQVLANDSDPDGSPLTIVSAEPNDAQTTAEIVGDVVRVTPPSTPGDYGVIYQIENETGGSSQNFIRVTVDPDAELAYPVAEDAVLTLTDIIDRDVVTVDVLANVFFADGDARDLGLSIHPGYNANATVTSDKRVDVTITARSQIIPFKLTHPDDPEVFGYAFIRVPGTDDALPQLDRRAPALRVNSEDQLRIELNEQVIAVGGDVRLTDSSTVRATHSNGDELVVDDDTLVYTSADKYFGPASISFEVVDPDGRRAVLVLPITVRPRENQPPVFGGGVIEFEPGQEKVLDLVRLTTYPYPDDLDELAYTVLTPAPTGFTYALNGTELSLRANPGTAKGSVTTITLGVRDDLTEGKAGRIELHVVPSTKPRVQPAADSAIAKRGETTTIDVLANDQATNPFPGEPLTVLAIRGLDGADLPEGVAIEPSADNRRLTVTVSPTAAPGDVNLQYQVVDATGDPDRAVWGTVVVSVQDRPDPVQNLAPSGYGDRTITMRWNAGQANNSPITGYTVTTSRSGTVLDSTTCTGTTCTIATPGNGPAEAVTVTVTATNAIGVSDPVVLATPVWSDVIPAAPGGLGAAPLDGGLLLTWAAVANPVGGTPVDRYRVTFGAYSTDVDASVCSGGTCSLDTRGVGPLTNGVAVTFTVSARNAAFPALSTWNTSEPASGIPAGPPIAGPAPLATALNDTTVQLDWSGVFADNGRPITNYSAVSFAGSPPACSATGGTATSTQFNGLQAGTEYRFVVFAANSQGCTSSAVVVARTPPAVVTALSTSLVENDGRWDFVVTGGTLGGAALSSDYTLYYTLSTGGGEQGPIALGQPLLGVGFDHYGLDTAVSVRACRDYGSGPLCQPASSVSIPLGVPVDARVDGLRWTPDGIVGGAFDWTGWPSGAYESVQYRCSTSPGGGGASFVPADTTAPGHCDVSGLTLLGAYLTIRVLANGNQTYDYTYRSN